VDVCFEIRQRMKELGLEQRDLAAAAEVTESYISQLLTRKKAPPAVERTDLYEKMNAFLKLPKGQLSAMVRAQRREELKKELADPPAPLFKEVRKLIIRKCRSDRRMQVRDIFEKQAFGELERLVTQKLLDVCKGIARDELKNENWLRGAAKLRRQSYEELRAMTLEFLDEDVFNVSIVHCSAFLEPVIDSWDIDLKTFAMDIALNKRLAPAHRMRFQFVETEESLSSEDAPGFKEFLRNTAMSGDATSEEIEFLKSLRFKQHRPSPLYYYRELQSLRDALHFPEDSPVTMHKRRNASDAGKLIGIESRKNALRRWARNKDGPHKLGKTKPS
jgi:transcriptional regulator with XRE-family HTH domain